MHFYFICYLFLLAGVTSTKEQFIIKVILFTLRHLMIKIND